MERQEASLLLDLLIKLFHMDGGTLHRVNGIAGSGPPLLVTARGLDTMQEIIGHLFESNLVEHLQGLRHERRDQLCLDLALIGAYFPGVKPLLHAGQVKSLLLTPLFHADDLVGVLAVFGRNYTALEEGDTDLLASISGRLGHILKNLETGVEPLPHAEARAGWRLPAMLGSVLRATSSADTLDECLSASLQLLADGLHCGAVFLAFDAPALEHRSFHSYTAGGSGREREEPSREFFSMASTLQHLTVVRPDSPVMTSLPGRRLAASQGLQALLVPSRDDGGSSMLACIYLRPEQRLTREEMESLRPLVSLMLNQAAARLARRRDAVRLRALEALADMTGELASYEGDARDMHALAGRCLEMLGCDRAAVVMPGECRGACETVVRSRDGAGGDDLSLVHNPLVASVLREWGSAGAGASGGEPGREPPPLPADDLLVLPLAGRESVLGALVLEKAGGFGGSGELVRCLARAVACQAAMLLERRQERRSMTAAGGEIDFLSTLNRRVFAATSFEELGAALYEELHRHLGVELLLIAGPGRSGALAGWSRGEPVDARPFEEMLHARSTLARTLASEGASVRSNLGASFRDAGERALARMRLRSYAAVPLPDEAEGPGILLVASPAANPFGEEALARLRQAAACTASASRLPLLYDRLESEYSRLSEAYDQLEEVISVQGDLLHIAAHEIRSPLTLIMGFAEVIRDYYDTMQRGERDQVVDRLLRSVDRLRRSVINMLELSRLESGQFEIQADRFDLKDLLEELVEEFKPRSIPCDLEVAAWGDGGEICADRDKLEIVLFNLIDNAIKFSQPGSRISVSGRLFPDHAVLEVSDQGKGIGSEYVDAVFEPFERGEEAKRVSAQGMGLGLYIVKKLVEAHGGRIELRTKQGEGSTFTIVIPQNGKAQSSRPCSREALRA